MTPDRSTFALAGALACVLLGAAGCLMQPSISARVTTADGQTLEVPLNSGNSPTTDEVVTVNAMQFAPWDMGPDKPKEITFSFIVQFKEGSKPSSIVVDDVTEAPILQIYADEHAKIVKANIWGAVTKPYAVQDEHVKWVLNLDNNVRVYRFTVKLTDGTTHVLYRPIFVPAQMKAFVRTQLGVG